MLSSIRNEHILIGWKEISNFLEVCIDTARSYEKKGMPVTRTITNRPVIKVEDVKSWITS